MATFMKTYNLPSGNRDQKRKALISCFLDEIPGSGTDQNASRYQYNVEKYGEYGIFLKRPTQLNKGFDFTVNVQGLYFKKNRKYSNPSHQDIFNALTTCKTEYPTKYIAIQTALTNIYNCEDYNIENIDAYFRDYEGRQHPIQVILLAVKWLFMEQDCAYWNYSGRKMFFEGLSSNGLV